ncbi:MAG: membrane protein insertase YidC [Candidatus Omnitrophica bacterium]|nr:membrane protein insertase YidC [Candidatus Omnitrophota bacterium]
MEKRLLLAFALSFVVLSAWSALNPSVQKTESKQSEVVVNKNDIENNQTVKTFAVLRNPIVDIKDEEIFVLENDKIKVEFSNIGGSIKSISVKEFNVSLPITKIFNIDGTQNSLFAFTQLNQNEISYTFQNGSSKIIKTYKLSKNDYLIEANVQTDDLSNLKIGGYVIDSASLDEKYAKSHERGLYEYSVGLFGQVIRKGNAIEFSEKENRVQAGEVSWAGYRDRYFCLVLKPQFKTESFSFLTNSKTNLSIDFVPVKESSNLYSATLFVGPQKLHLLSSYKMGFENIMVFSNWGIFDIFAKMIYFFVHFLFGIFKSWGIAILVLGVSLYAATYPLTAKSMLSMRKMQALQPKMKSLQEKYKNDPQRLNREMMELYKENKVNPFGGCLPMVLQMPIFYGLYQVLWRSVDFKGASFLWIKDLSLPDRLFTLSTTLPIIGNEINILPILMAVIMFFQQKFTSRNMVISDPNQAMQQKMMGTLMPVMMGFIFYHFASGLALYFTVFYLLSTLTQWKMSKVSEIEK